MFSYICCSLMKFSWWIETKFVSAILFGEYPYPTEDNS